MNIFDAQIRSDTRNDDDLRNLAYFGTVEAVTTAHAPLPFEDSADVLRYFQGLVGNEVARLERCGITANVALGVLPSAQPRRAHPELWSSLPKMLADPRVVAIGEIGAWEDTRTHWALFDRQVKLAIDVNLPVIVTPPYDLRINMTYKMMARLEKAGLPPQRCLMNLLDDVLLRTVVQEGFIGGVAVGYQQWLPREAAKMLAGVLDDLPAAATRTIINSSLRRGGADVLGIPKTAEALLDVGVAQETLARLVFENAADFFRSDC